MIQEISQFYFFNLIVFVLLAPLGFGLVVLPRPCGAWADVALDQTVRPPSAPRCPISNLESRAGP